MNQDEEHLKLLSIFHYVCAALCVLFGCFPFIYVIMGIVMLVSPESMGPAKDQPPAFVGIILVCMGAAMIVFGWGMAGCIAYAGRCLGVRKHYTFCLVVAAIACLFMPFGTILGVFTIVVLVRPSVKALFDQVAPPAFPK